MNREPFFSVLMPLYNHEQFVGSAVQSVLDQTFTDYELVICDDGSTDNSFGVVSSFADDRIRIIRRDNGGTTSALNSCLLASRGRYICWLSSDDLFAPTKLEFHFNHHRSQPNSRFSIAPFGWISGANVLPREQKVPIPVLRLLEFVDGSYINGLSVCAERSLYVVQGGFNHSFRYAQDIEQWFSLLRKVSPIFLEGPPQSFSRKGTSTLPNSSLLGHLDGIRIFLRAMVFGGLTSFIPEGEERELSNPATMARLAELCISPNNYFHRFGIQEIFWGGVKDYLSPNSELTELFLACMRTIELSGFSGLVQNAGRFLGWWDSSDRNARIQSSDVLGLYVRILQGIPDPKVREVFQSYFAKIL
jgi:glycosyltransferase involved in cell wall biosynthesis